MAPKVLPVEYSANTGVQREWRGKARDNTPHMPAANWARPPTKQAIPMTALGTVIPRALTLYMERTKVVLAKEKRPLKR